MQISVRSLRGYFFLIILGSIAENHAMLSDDEGEQSPFLHPVGEILYPPAPPPSPTMLDTQQGDRPHSPAFCSLASSSPRSLEEETEEIIQQWQGATATHGPEKIAPLNREAIIDGLASLLEKSRLSQPPAHAFLGRDAAQLYQELLEEETTPAEVWAGLYTTVFELLKRREEHHLKKS